MMKGAQNKVPPPDIEDPGSETLTAAPASSQGTQDREVEALLRTMYFTTYPTSQT
jgi:hypothetical protein